MGHDSTSVSPRSEAACSSSFRLLHGDGTGCLGTGSGLDSRLPVQLTTHGHKPIWCLCIELFCPKLDFGMLHHARHLSSQVVNLGSSKSGFG